MSRRLKTESQACQTQVGRQLDSCQTEGNLTNTACDHTKHMVIDRSEWGRKDQERGLD